MEHLLLETGVPLLIGHPPAEPSALLAEARTALRTLPPVSTASRAWLSVPGRGASLVIAVGLDDPESEQARTAATDAIEHAATVAALRVPFRLDVTFTGERVPGARVAEAQDDQAQGDEARADDARELGARDAEVTTADAIDDWIARNTRPFYVRA